MIKSRKSVSALLLALLAVLATGALVSTAAQMAAAFSHYRDSLEARRFAAADKAIFEGVLSLRNSRGDAQSALLSDDDPRARLMDIEGVERAGYESIVAALATVDFDGRDELAGAM
ncbi:hypothetical protein AYJ54_33505 [Bradyrhizobium centrolobii]|uniref:Methyl-accepting chemotaxis protein n=1 Tax=Bradyrhizobium centrolobii TaxID=1505087 RepID=A0A176YA36_9BRAD|nr:hypothetical protein [Bradyrhizobium centrolobii]OAE98968.1 hypothetical protein AYJ54_33505 [Bradyrhizobium centrolobii]